MIRKAVVAAAGKGTRLLSATKELPKEMLPIFSKNGGEISIKPILQIIFEQLDDLGVNEFCFIVGRGKRAIEDHFTPDLPFLEDMSKKGRRSQAKDLTDFYNKITKSQIVWINQPKPMGFGDAVLKSQVFTGDDDFTISTQQGLIDTLNETTQTLVIFLGTVAGISLLVGGIGVMNIMLVSVTERTREIGIRKAIGAKKRDILFQFITESIFLTLSGGLIGVLIGISFTPLLGGFRLFGPNPIEASFRADVAVLALVVSVVIGLVSVIYPAMRAANMHPIDALRYE